MKNISVYMLMLVLTLSPVTVAATNSNSNSEQKLSSNYYDLVLRFLTAEMAANRNIPNVALNNYMQIAKESLDPEVAKIATEYALESMALEKALEAAEIWSKSAPDEIQPHMVAMSLVINQSQDAAIPFLKSALKIKDDDLDDHLLSVMSRLNAESRVNMLDAVEKILNEEKIDNIYAYLAGAQIAAHSSRIKNAEKWLEKVITEDATITSAIELKAKIIRHKKNDDEPALKFLQGVLKQQPNNNRLKMFYTKALLDNYKHDLAIPELNALIKTEDYNEEARNILAEIHIAKEKFSKARELLAKNVDSKEFGSKAKFLLGQIAENQNKHKKAIEWYSSIVESNYHIPAYLRAVYLLALQDEFNQAIKLLHDANPSNFVEQKQISLTEIDLLIENGDLDEALQETNYVLQFSPNDIELLYSRSLIANLLKEIEMAELDLRKILEIEPNHANALNALGFTLTSTPEKRPEAMELIKKAISLVPNNPAFLDSMGWLYYKMGNIDKALEHLEQAYKLHSDGEIAAHYGEVLWVSGEKAKAQAIWQRALKNYPKNRSLNETVSRFKFQEAETIKQVEAPTR